MAFSIGQQVLLLRADTDPRKSIIEHQIITKVSAKGDMVWCGNNHNPEDCMYSAFLMPYTEESLAYFADCISIAIRHKDEQNALQTRVYQLLNKQTLAGER